MFGQNPSPLDALLHRPPPSAWELFTRAPCVFLARKLCHSVRPPVAIPSIPEPPPSSDAVSVVCISDTHNSQCSVPDGDILIHAGDLTKSGSRLEIQETLSWLQAQPHPTKIVVAGNHDVLLDPSRDRDKEAEARKRIDWGDIVYLQDSSTTVVVDTRVLQIHGSPRTPRHGNGAFQYPRGEQDVWTSSETAIAVKADILITHGPPMGHLDLFDGLGCRHLLRALWRLRTAALKLHVCGHIHAGYGHEYLFFDGLQGAYEQVMLDRGGIWNLVKLLGHSAAAAAAAAMIFGGRTAKQKKPVMQLVNASIVGGLRDELRREPIKVWI